MDLLRNLCPKNLNDLVVGNTVVDRIPTEELSALMRPCAALLDDVLTPFDNLLGICLKFRLQILLGLIICIYRFVQILEASLWRSPFCFARPSREEKGGDRPRGPVGSAQRFRASRARRSPPTSPTQYRVRRARSTPTARRLPSLLSSGCPGPTCTLWQAARCVGSVDLSSLLDAQECHLVALYRRRLAGIRDFLPNPRRLVLARPHRLLIPPREMATAVPLWRSTRKTVPFMPSVCPNSVGKTRFLVCRASSTASGVAPS